MPINTPTGYLDITNATLRGSKIVTTGFVGIANANPTNHLSVGSNLHINDTHSNVLQISGNINAASVVLGGISIAPTFDLEIVTNTGNTTPYTVEFNNAATAFVTTANATIGDTLTASKLVGDGSGISAIQSSNVTDFASNVSRITTLETSRALKSDLNNNSSRITNLSSNLSDNSARITNLSSNLSDNSSRITTLESGDFSISGEKTFTGQVIFESNIHMAGGNVFVANTINMTVFDPIMELGSNNLNTGDLGIVMTRHNNNSNIAFVYDESDDILRMGYTLNGASSSVIYLDSNALAVGVQGTMTADKIVASNVIPATSTTTGALTVAGGVGVDGNVHCSNLYANNITMNLVSFSGLQTFEQVVNNGRILNSNVLIISNATPSTSSATGALTLTAGGLGVEGNVHIGSNLFVTGETTLSNLSVTGDATVSNLSVTGETVEVANLAVTSGSLELTQIANVFQVKSSSNVVTEYARSKKLIKYPRVAMMSASQDGYVVTASSIRPDSGGYSYDGYNAFDNTKSVGFTGSWTPETNSNYNLSGNVYNPAVDTPTRNLGTGAVDGEWLKLELPNKIRLEHVKLAFDQTNDPTRAPKDFLIYGSNDNVNWTELLSVINANYMGSSSTVARDTSHDVKTTTFYQYFGVVVTKISGQPTYFRIHELEYYGVPEYDPDAHGTDVIARSIPNVPNTDWLEVYYDGQDYTSMPSTVTDKSGNGVTGTPTNGVTFDSTWKAFTFDGSGDYIKGAIPSSLSGNHPYTFSLWIKPDAIQSSFKAVFEMGNRANNQSCGLYLNGGSIVHLAFANNLTTSTSVVPNQWIHITGTYTSGSRKVYADGVLLATDAYSSMNIGSTEMTLGANNDDSQEFDGSIANFRVFNRALTGDEIWQLYAYQKDYFQVSPDVVTFKGGRLGIGTREPKAPLDVMGIPYGPGARPIFSAYEYDDYSFTAAGYVALGNTFVNDLDCYSTSTGIFVAPLDGIYCFIGNCVIRSSGGSGNSTWTFHINDTNWNPTSTSRPIAFQTIDNGTNHQQTSGSLIFYMNKGDNMRIYALGIPSNTNQNWGQGYGRFLGFLLS